MDAAKKTIVLDVNGLLLEKLYDPQGAHVNNGCVRVGKFSVFVRPHAREFVAWCLRRFEVVIWSTSQRRTLRPLLPLIFSPTVRLTVMDQTDCVLLRSAHPSFPGKPLFVKRFPPHLLTGEVLLIDDACYKAALNPPETSVHPPQWSHLCTGDADLVLRQLRDVLCVFEAESTEAAARQAEQTSGWSCPSSDRLYIDIQTGAVA
jgi:hypothetical protein